MLSYIQEAKGSYSAAQEVYDAVLKETPSNQLAAKRLIALAKHSAASKTVPREREQADLHVLEQLNEYVQVFGGDIEAVRGRLPQA